MNLERRTCVALLSLSLASFASLEARAAPGSGSCQKDLQQGRELIRGGQLRRARAALSECARTTCDGFVVQQCRSALMRLEEDTPSVVFVATTPAGDRIVDVSVSMDGEALVSGLDGRSVAVDPGMHEFSFSIGSGEAHREKLLILEGQHNRVISVQLSPAAPAAVTPASPPSPPATAATDAPAAPAPPRETAHEEAHDPPILAYVVGGVGLAAVGTSFLLAHWAREDNVRLDRCAPNCTQDSVDHVRSMYIAADIALGAGVVALGAATWLYLSHPGAEQPADTQRAYRFDVRPLASGAFATMRGAF